MEDILFFHLSSCPHCKKAFALLEELIGENTDYKKIDIKTIEERENAKLADSFDYYYVPCFYVNGEKKHEGAITKSELKSVLDSAIME